MLAATGSGLEREVLLGTGMFALHNVGILSRPLIASVLHGVAASESGSFMDGLYAEPLDTPESQPEEISISQEPVDVDQATKLWSALQSPLRPSAFYKVQAVFLVPDEAYPDPNTVDEVNIAVVPDPVRADQGRSMSALVPLAGRLTADALTASAKGEALAGFAPLHAALEAGEGRRWPILPRPSIWRRAKWNSSPSFWPARPRPRSRARWLRPRAV